MTAHPVRSDLTSVPRWGLAARAALRRAAVGRRRAWTLDRHDPEAPAVAHLRVGAAARWGWGLPLPVAEALAEVAAVLVDNAVRHTPSPHVTVVVSTADGRATVAVQDDGPATVFPPPGGYGTGLRHVAARADEWGHHVTVEGGTRVYASIKLPEDA